ncbi:hypothetical protein ADUPG1_003323, partial [Aduncisulcus paluster]
MSRCCVLDYSLRNRILDVFIDICDVHGPTVLFIIPTFLNTCARGLIECIKKNRGDYKISSTEKSERKDNTSYSEGKDREYSDVNAPPLPPPPPPSSLPPPLPPLPPSETSSIATLSSSPAPSSSLIPKQEDDHSSCESPKVEGKD